MSGRHKDGKGVKHPTCAALRPAPGLLSESAEELRQLYQWFRRELKPRDAIEEAFVVDITNATWQSLLLDRCKTGILNTAYKETLREIMALFSPPEGENPFPSSDPLYTVEEAYKKYYANLKKKLVDSKRLDIEEDAHQLAQRWLSDDEARDTAQLLHIDNSLIESEAVRRALPDIERFNRVLDVLQSRRYRAIRWLAEYRSTLAPMLNSGS